MPSLQLSLWHGTLTWSIRVQSKRSTCVTKYQIIHLIFLFQKSFFCPISSSRQARNNDGQNWNMLTIIGHTESNTPWNLDHIVYLVAIHVARRQSRRVTVQKTGNWRNGAIKCWHVEWKGLDQHTTLEIIRNFDSILKPNSTECKQLHRR